MDLEQFKDDMSFGADMAGVAQRRAQQQSLDEVKDLLQQQQAEQNRLKSLPPCPACQKPLELGSRKCPSCHDDIIWCLGLPFRHTQPNEELTDYALRHAQKTLTAIDAYDTGTRKTHLPTAHDMLVSCAESAVEHMGSLSEYEAATLSKTDTDNAIARIKRMWWQCLVPLPGILFVGLWVIVEMSPALLGLRGDYDHDGEFRLTETSSSYLLYSLWTIAGVCVAAWPAAYWLSRRRIAVHQRILDAMEGPATFEAAARIVLENIWSEENTIMSDVAALADTLNNCGACLRPDATTTISHAHANACKWQPAGVASVDELPSDVLALTEYVARIGGYDTPAYDKLNDTVDGRDVASSATTPRQEAHDQELSVPGINEVQSDHQDEPEQESPKDSDSAFGIWIKDGEVSIGPYTARRIVELVKSKHLRKGTLVASSEHGEYRPLGDVYKKIVALAKEGK